MPAARASCRAPASSRSRASWSPRSPPGSTSSRDERPRTAAPKAPLRPARRDRAKREGAPMSPGDARTRVDVRILDPRIADRMPAYATSGSAGLDLRACIDVPLVLAPGAAELVPTGLAIHLGDPGFAAM